MVTLMILLVGNLPEAGLGSIPVFLMENKWFLQGICAVLSKEFEAVTALRALIANSLLQGSVPFISTDKSAYKPSAQVCPFTAIEAVTAC